MVYITGDTHGEFKRIQEFCYKFKTTKQDILIILGDAGINYFGKLDNKLKEYLQSLPITFFCIYGNHEERPENIKTYKEIEKFKGIVYRENDYPNLLFSKDGEIYTINNKKVLVIGGAFSINKDLMIKAGYKWFKDELPSDLIKSRVITNLKNNNNEVDIILSHTCPYKYLPHEMFHIGVDQDKVDQSLEHFLDEIEEKTDYKKWYCGHFHTDKIIDKMVFMFEGIKNLE